MNTIAARGAKAVAELVRSHPADGNQQGTRQEGRVVVRDHGAAGCLSLGGTHVGWKLSPGDGGLRWRQGLQPPTSPSQHEHGRDDAAFHPTN